MAENSLNKIKDRLKQLAASDKTRNYLIPTLWLSQDDFIQSETIDVNPYLFFYNKIIEIKKLSRNFKKIESSENWSPKAVVYSMLARYTTAFDHNGNGKIDIGQTEKGFMETGTFLKSIALLPYLKHLGINTIYLLPVTSIGVDGRKGNLGSPYAIKNPYQLDNNLSEPFLQMNIEDQFSAFVEAAHLLNIKIVVEFVFRTASIDSDLAIKNPDWFYWIDSKIKNRSGTTISSSQEPTKELYGSPVFNKEELELIRSKIGNGDFNNLPDPLSQFKSLFLETPQKIRKVKGQIIAEINSGQMCRIPSAFADWPPDDIQPPWDDVTYLRLFNSKKFNYIAYNTIRMYDNKLLKEDCKVKSLWKNIINIIPHYQNQFGIDGVMIDMGHALPDELRSKIIKTARNNNPNFIFWEENFALTESSVKEGYNASLGYLCFVQHKAHKLKELIDLMANNKTPIPFFLTPETHNTPRSASRPGNESYSKFAVTVNSLLPGVLFINSGIELFEQSPVNTGLGFSLEEIIKYPTEKLPLFSATALSWQNYDNMIQHLKKMIELRKKYFQSDFDLTGLALLDSGNESIVAFLRKTKKRNTELMFIGNMHSNKELFFSFKLPHEFTFLKRIGQTGKTKILNHEYISNLKPFEYFIAELIRY